MIDPKVIGRRLVALRGGKRREDVARDLEISPSAVTMYENGERIPRDEIKVKIAQYYDATVQEIFFDE